MPRDWIKSVERQGSSVAFGDPTFDVEGEAAGRYWALSSETYCSARATISMISLDVSRRSSHR
jgi:hypothetical protein